MRSESDDPIGADDVVGPRVATSLLNLEKVVLLGIVEVHSAVLIAGDILGERDLHRAKVGAVMLDNNQYWDVTFELVFR